VRCHGRFIWRVRAWLASLAAVLVAAVTALLLPTGGLAPAGPWKPFPGGGWAFVRVNTEGRGMVLEGEPAGVALPCEEPPPVGVREYRDRIVLSFPRPACLYQIPVPTDDPLGNRAVVTSDGYRLPVLSEGILPRPTYPAGLKLEPGAFPIGGNAPRPVHMIQYALVPEGRGSSAYRVDVGATLDDGHVVQPGTHVTIHGHDVTIEALPASSEDQPYPRQEAMWVDHGWVVFVQLRVVQNMAPVTDRDELIRVLNGLVWPT
jgi:hypothetical protein